VKGPQAPNQCYEHDDETGLIYAQQRWVDYETGQFISEDPVMDGLNWYAYAGGNPMGNVDPTGLESRADAYRSWESRPSMKVYDSRYAGNGNYGGFINGYYENDYNSSGNGRYFINIERDQWSNINDGEGNGSSIDVKDADLWITDWDEIQSRMEGKSPEDFFDVRNSYLEAKYTSLSVVPGVRMFKQQFFMHPDFYDITQKYSTACNVAEMVNIISVKYSKITGKYLSAQQAIDIVNTNLRTLVDTRIKTNVIGDFAHIYKSDQFLRNGWIAINMDKYGIWKELTKPPSSPESSLSKYAYSVYESANVTPEYFTKLKINYFGYKHFVNVIDNSRITTVHDPNVNKIIDIQNRNILGTSYYAFIPKLRF
jgi:RHS repeat-associated protein